MSLVTDPEPKPFLGSLTGEVGRGRNFHGGRQTPEVSFRIAGAVTFPGSQQLCRLPCGARYWLRGGQKSYRLCSIVALFRRLHWWASVFLQVY